MMLLNENLPQKKRIQNEITNEQQIYRTLLSLAKEAHLEVDDVDLIEELRQFYIAPIKKKMGNVITEDKMLNLAEREGELSFAKQLLAKIKYMDIHTGKMALETFCIKNIYSYTNEPKAKETASKIQSAAYIMKEIGLPTGIINDAFRRFGYSAADDNFNAYTLEYHLGVHKSQKKQPA